MSFDAPQYIQQNLPPHQGEASGDPACGTGSPGRAGHSATAHGTRSDLAPPEPRPYWLPDGLDFEALPEAYRLAVADLLAPVYRALVVEVADPLERMTGATIAHLVALELREQFSLGRELPDLSRPVSPAYEQSLGPAAHHRGQGQDLQFLAAPPWT